jgi:hypothetical protein
MGVVGLVLILNLERLLVLFDLGLELLELRFGQIGWQFSLPRDLCVGRGVLEGAGRTRGPIAGTARIPRTARDGLRTASPPFLGTFAIPGHGSLLRVQRVSRWTVWHLHQRQYFRS